jgi:hypothetical protein
MFSLIHIYGKEVALIKSTVYVSICVAGLIVASFTRCIHSMLMTFEVPNPIKTCWV